MLWARLLAYVTGTVDQELLLRNEYLAAENRILRGQIKDRLLLSEGEKAILAEIAKGSGHHDEEVASHNGLGMISYERHRGETRMRSLRSNSAAIRSSPHVGFSRAILWISFCTSSRNRGLPRGLDFHRQSN